MRFPNLLASKRGRLATFFLLYVTEGIPLGFTATAIATQMRRQGLGVAEIGAFVGSLYLPWAFKWAFGPFVDVLASDRWGRRRMWIVLAQAMMIATLMVALPVNFTTEVKLFTLLILLHNAFAATQDVAIDALAVGVVPERERGLVNGFMFGGAYLGQTIGGSGALFLAPLVGFQNTYFFVASCILAVTLFVAIPIREPKGPIRPIEPGSALARTGREIVTFVRESLRAFFGSRAAFIGLLFAVLPSGAYALGLALQSNLAVELGLTDPQIAGLNLWSTIVSALGCVLGGWLSDRFGRKRTLALFVVSMSLPTLYLAWAMQNFGWVMPVNPQMPNRPVAPAALVSTLWLTTIVYAAFNGLMYGTRSALFMDVTTVRVAATQFTAYMALLNFVISYTATWQGQALERWGYPVTLTLDAVIGLASLALLPLMAVRRRGPAPVTPVSEAIPEGVQP